MFILLSIVLYYSSSFCEGSTYFPYTSNFLDVFQSSGFVDKSMLIKTILNGPKPILITAPRRFGKSTNLDMVKTFLSVESADNSEISNVFRKLKVYENDSAFFKDHFGKYPVLHISFTTGDDIRNYDDAVSQFRRSISDSYNEHKYLQRSSRLTEKEKTKCVNWVDDFEEITEENVRCSLGLFVRYLNRHHGKPVIVLIDDYDSVINDGLFSCKSDEDIKSIVKLTSKLLGSLAKGNKNVDRIIITGISYISCTGLSEINNLRIYRFLDDHELVKFYGFTEAETNLLFRKKEFHSYSERKHFIKQLYNGYISKNGIYIYNTYSFLMFLETGTANYYWDDTQYISRLMDLIKYQRIEQSIDHLLNGKTIKIVVLQRTSISDVIKLKNIYQNHSSNDNYHDLIFSHLFEIGYLTYLRGTNIDYAGMKTVTLTVIVKLPNKEIRKSMLQIYKTYYVQLYNLDEQDIERMNFNDFKEYLTEFLNYGDKSPPKSPETVSTFL